MEQFLDAYIDRMKPAFRGLTPAIAHEIASAFLAFKYGMYDNAVRECGHAISRIPEGGAPHAALKKALTILLANAKYRINAQETVDSSLTFTAGEQTFVAVKPAPERIEDQGTLDLDNSLVLVWVVALITSSDDEEALDEHRRMIVRLLTDYKKALGME